jgi:predicted lipoprotein with Yx(FWY)xxD motif
MQGTPPGLRIEMADDLGPVYADSSGHTLYTWDRDTEPGVSKCNADHYTQVTGQNQIKYALPDAAARPTCQEVWLPYGAAADIPPSGHWSVIHRTDGTLQWAYDNHPAYRFLHDHEPGEVNGAGPGLGRMYGARTPLFVPLDAPPGVTVRATRQGRVLMTGGGKPLYAFDSDSASKVTCLDLCPRTWTPFEAAAAAQQSTAKSEWRIVHRPDGMLQWAYRNKPLYTYAGDTRFGEVSADEAHWKPVAVSPWLAPPRDLTTQMTVDGEVFADRRGMTVYIFSCTEESPDGALCDIPATSQAYRRSLCGTPENCMATWRPVPASRAAKPVGHTWSVETIDPTGKNQYADPGQKNGLLVWAYRGRPIYTYAGDKDLGDMNGHNIRAFELWGYGMVRTEW